MGGGVTKIAFNDNGLIFYYYFIITVFVDSEKFGLKPKQDQVKMPSNLDKTKTTKKLS